MLEGKSNKISSSSLEKEYTSKEEVEDVIKGFFNQEKYQDYAASVQGVLISRIPDKGLFLGGASGKRNITNFLNKCFNNSSWIFPESFSSISVEKKIELFNALRFFLFEKFSLNS